MSKTAIIFLGVLAGLGPFAVEIYLPAQNQLVETFHTDPTLISMNIGIFFIGMAIGQFFGGPLSDANGRRPILLVSLFVFVIAGILICFAPTAQVFITLRGLQAISAGTVAVLAIAIISDKCDEVNTARIISQITVIAILIRILSPVAGGLLTSVYGWQAPFVVMVTVGSVTIFYALKHQDETHQTGNRGKLKPSTIIDDYMKLLTDARSRTFIGIEILSTTGLFAYVSAAPLIFMNTYSFDSKEFSYIYAGLTIVLMISALLNSLLVKKVEILKLLKLTIPAMFCIATLLMLTPGYYLSNPLFFVLLLCAYMIPMMMTRLNATAVAVKCFPGIAGTMAALISVIGFAVGGLSGLLSGYLYDKLEFVLVYILFVSAFLNLTLYLISKKSFYPAES